MSDQASQGSVSGSGYDGAFADSILRNCEEEAASLQQVLGSAPQAPAWNLGARLGDIQPAGVDSLLLAKCPGNAVLVPQHGGPSQSSGASLQEPSAYVHQSMASLLQPGSRDPGYFQALLATGSPDVQWATSSNYASQGLGPVKQLLFEPLSVHTVPPLETTPQNWLQLEKHPAASYRADVAATPLSQIQSRNPSLECGWSLQDGSFSQAQCYTPARQHLVAPKTGVATNPEDRRPIWQHAGSHVQPAAFQGSNLDMRKEHAPRCGPPAPIQKETLAAARQPQQPQHGKQRLASAPQGRHYMSTTALNFQGHPPQVSLQPLRDQAEHLQRNRLVHQSAHRFEGGRIGRRWEKQESREKKLHAQSSGQQSLSSLPSPAPDLPSLHPRQQAPPRPPGLRLNALFQDVPPAIPKQHHSAKQAPATELRYSRPEATGVSSQRQGPPTYQSSQGSDRRHPPAQKRVLGRDTPWLAGAKPLLTQQGTVHSNYPQRAEDAFWGEPQATAVTVGAQGGQGQARNLGVRSSVYEDGLRARQMVGGQGIDARPHWHAATKSPNRGLHTNKAHVAVSMHSQMQPSAPNAQSTPQLLVVPQERAQKDSVGRDTPAIRALQSQLSSTQRAVEGTTHGIWRSTEPASATFQKLNTLSGPDEPTPLQSMAPLDTLEASAEHVPSRANRQRGRAPRKAVRMSAQGGTPEQVDLVSGHAAVSESSFPLGPGALKGWLGYSDGTGVPGTESHREFQEDDWEEKPLGEQGLGETAEGEAVDRYPLGRFSRASAKFDQALGFENVDEFGHELSEGKKRSRDEAESEAERATYLSNVEALIGTNAAARSRIACELEKQAIILALEEGHVVKRIKSMGILSGSAPPHAAPEPAASTPSGAVCPHVGPEPTQSDAGAVSENRGPFLDGLPITKTEMPGLQPVVADDRTETLKTGLDPVERVDGSEGGPLDQLATAAPTEGSPFLSTAQQVATPFGCPPTQYAVLSDPGQPTAGLFADIEDAMSDSEDKENIRPNEDAAASDDMDFETEMDPSPPPGEQSGNASPVLLTPTTGEGVPHSVGNAVSSHGAGAAGRAGGGFLSAMVLQEPVRCALGSSEETGEDDYLLALQPAAKRHKAYHSSLTFAPGTPAEAAASVFAGSPRGEAREKHDSPPLRSKVARPLVSHPMTPPKSSFPSLSSPTNQTLPIATRWSVSSRTPSPPSGKAGGVPSPKSSPDRMRPALCSAPYNLGSPTKSREGRGPFSSPQKTSPGRKTIPSPTKSRNSTASPPKKGSKGSGPSSSSSRSMGPSPPKSSPAKMARLI